MKLSTRLDGKESNKAAESRERNRRTNGWCLSWELESWRSRKGLTLQHVLTQQLFVTLCAKKEPCRWISKTQVIKTYNIEARPTGHFLLSTQLKTDMFSLAPKKTLQDWKGFVPNCCTVLVLAMELGPILYNYQNYIGKNWGKPARVEAYMSGLRDWP